ncbi:MAG: phosphoenolpyruvate--protein phosphotransferase [FCB group bacterium]|nr:phosphoenolpyruvate--protein phosphotransferase [FCB group bacterium]
MEIALRGIGVSPGIAIGPALNFGVRSLDVPKYQVKDKEAERQRFHRAVEAVRKELQDLYDRTSRGLGAHHADIFKAHQMLLDDVTLHQEFESRLESEGLNAEYIVDDLIVRYSKMLTTVDDPLFRERAQDFFDVGTRVLGHLLNTELDNLEHLERPCIIVAHDLSPSDTAKMDLANVLGIATDVSGPTSHTAILARAFQVPAVVGLKYVGAHTLPGDTMIIDGTRGYVFIRPDEETLRKFAAEREHDVVRRHSAMVAGLARPSSTLDGFEIPTMVNVELPVEITPELKTKAQGIGLYRTEYIFLNRSSLPTEEEQFAAYSSVAEIMKPAPAILRTLDIGGDKFVSHLQLAEEINPQLGWRAIRFCLERPDIFKAQLRAMLRASVHGNVQIMFPLISGVDELLRVKEVVREVCNDLERRGIAFDRQVKLGSMIEVPSAVAVADLLARECDFFSIGTNDLIQYSLAVDRVNEKIAHMYEPAHPAILRMIRQTARAARAAHIPCGICGEVAGDPLFTEVLIGLGVNSLSMSAVALPGVRAEVAKTRMSSAKQFARQLLGQTSVHTVRAMLNQRFKERQQSSE